MSTRRFAAYFFAIAAGSTVAFASTVMGQPAPTEAVMSGTVTTEPEMHLTSPDEGLDVLPATARIFRRQWNHTHHKSAAKIAQVAQVALAK